MSDWPTDEMIEAACNAATWDYVWVDGDDDIQVGEMIAAALAAAPTFDGWVWCEHRGQFTGYTPVDELRHGGACEDTDGGAVYDCPGPHRTLIVGPEVTP